MEIIRGFLALMFVISSLVISYKYSPRAFCLLAVIVMVQLLLEGLKNNG